MIVAIVVASTVVHCETVNVGDGACLRGGEDRCGVVDEKGGQHDACVQEVVLELDQARLLRCVCRELVVR